MEEMERKINGDDLDFVQPYLMFLPFLLCQILMFLI